MIEFFKWNDFNPIGLVGQFHRNGTHFFQITTGFGQKDGFIETRKGNLQQNFDEIMAAQGVVSAQILVRILLDGFHFVDKPGFFYFPPKQIAK